MSLLPESSVPPPGSPDGGTELAAKAVDYLLRVFASPRLKDENLPDELRAIDNMEQLSALAWAIRKLAQALGKGDLEYFSPEKGMVIGGLKELQSNLKHLTWQAKQIAGGDYSHKVDFIGDFSESFNLMTEQLASRITNLVHTRDEYKDKSFRDPLTGVYNRMAFMHYAEKALLHLEAGVRSSLIMADVDKFKNVNDRYGHLCGDVVLKAFAACLLEGIRPGDLCCRYGGEEFMILLPHTPFAASLVIAERLRSKVEKRDIFFNDLHISITASFGVSEIEGKGADTVFADLITSAISQADGKLYKAKESGRNRVIG